MNEANKIGWVPYALPVVRAFAALWMIFHGDPSSLEVDQPPPGDCPGVHDGGGGGSDDENDERQVDHEEVPVENDAPADKGEGRKGLPRRDDPSPSQVLALLGKMTQMMEEFDSNRRPLASAEERPLAKYKTAEERAKDSALQRSLSFRFVDPMSVCDSEMKSLRKEQDDVTLMSGRSLSVDEQLERKRIRDAKQFGNTNPVDFIDGMITLALLWLTLDVRKADVPALLKFTREIARMSTTLPACGAAYMKMAKAIMRDRPKAVSSWYEGLSDGRYTNIYVMPVLAADPPAYPPANRYAGTVTLSGNKRSLRNGLRNNSLGKIPKTFSSTSKRAIRSKICPALNGLVPVHDYPGVCFSRTTLRVPACCAPKGAASCSFSHACVHCGASHTASVCPGFPKSKDAFP